MVTIKPGEPITRAFFRALPDVERLDAIDLLESLDGISPDTDSDDLAMTLACLLDARPAAFGRELPLLDTLAVIVALIRDHHIDRSIPATDTAAVAAEAERLRGALGSVHDTRQQALCAVVRRVGGAAMFGIAAHLQRTLADPARQVAVDTLDAVEFLARGHGWHLIAAPGTRFVLYQTHNQ